MFFFEIDDDAIRSIPAVVAGKFKVLPLAVVENKIILLCNTKLTKRKLRSLKFFVPARTFYFVTPAEYPEQHRNIMRLIREHYNF